MYACSSKPETDFSRGCAPLRDQGCISSDPPSYLPFVDLVMPILSPSNQVSAFHHSESYALLPYRVIGNKL